MKEVITNEEAYYGAMREMIRKVQQGYEPPFKSDAEELEIFADCIRSGYLIGETTYIDYQGKEQEHRTLDGKMHPILYNHVVTPKGLAFLAKGTEKAASDDNEEEDDLFKHAFQRIKSISKRSWAIFTGVGTIVTVFGWPLILRFFAFLRSLFTNRY